MVTETEHPLNDRNNNNVSSYPPRTPMTKHKMVEVEDDGEKEKADDIKIHDEGDNNDDNDNNNKDIDEDDTDDENIDVGVEESDMDDQNASDPESSHGGNEMIDPVVMTHRLRHEDFHGLRTNTTSRLPGGLPSGLPDGLASGLPGCVVPIPSLPPPHLHLHPSTTPFHTTPQSLFLHGFHQPPNDPSRSNSNSPQQNTKHNNNNDNNNSNNNDINMKNTKTNPLSISPKTNFISKLSFGIDRILNENNNNHHHHSRSPNNLCKPTTPRETHESAEDAHQSQSDEEDPDEDNTNNSSIPRRHPPALPPQLSSFSSHRVHVITDPVHVQASSSSLTSPTTVVTPNRLPPRMIPGVDLVSPLSPFHGAVLPRDVCRVDPPSLDILPVRPAWPDVYVCPWTGVQRDRFGLVRRVGHPYQNRTPPKRKKPRTAFSRQQVLELEKRFTRQKYLASAERSALAKTLSMTDAQVKTWFQNRRTKWRRQTAEEREIERQAAHKFLLSLRPEDPNRPNIAAYGALCGVNQQGPQSVTEAPKSPGASSVN